MAVPGRTVQGRAYSICFSAPHCQLSFASVKKERSMRRGKTALGATVLSGLLVVVAALMLGVLSQATEGPRAAQAAAGEVLVLDVSAFDGGNGNTNLEGWFAAAGKTPVRVSSAVWATMTTADFAAYDAIALPDPTCATSPGSGDDSPIAAAKLNAATWGAAVDGNVIIIGTDEVFHDSQGGDALMDSATDFAVAEAGKTGAYISLACYYHDVASGTPLTWLDDAFGGTFTTTGVGCFNDSHIVAVHPALAGLTDAILSNWSCSVHEAFDGFPPAFVPLAIAEGIAGPGSITFADGSFGVPYILARGASPILCGDNILQATEECDDGNTDGGDGCSALCKIEACGNNVVDVGEECDDGNTDPGDGCSTACLIEVCGNGILDPGEEWDDGNTADDDGCSQVCLIENEAPICSGALADPGTLWPPNHVLVPIGISGVTDADGDPLTITATSVTQDEAVTGKGIGSGNTSPDAALSPLTVRSERNGNPKTPGNGRVYHVAFTADDGQGGSCNGTVAVCVPHDQRPDVTCVDDGPIYNSVP